MSSIRYQISMTRRTTGETYTTEVPISAPPSRYPESVGDLGERQHDAVARAAAVQIILNDQSLAMDVLEMAEVKPLEPLRGGPLRRPVEYDEDWQREVHREREAEKWERMRDEVNQLC